MIATHDDAMTGRNFSFGSRNIINVASYLFSRVCSSSSRPSSLDGEEGKLNAERSWCDLFRSVVGIRRTLASSTGKPFFLTDCGGVFKPAAIDPFVDWSLLCNDFMFLLTFSSLQQMSRPLFVRAFVCLCHDRNYQLIHSCASLLCFLMPPNRW